MQSVLLPTVIFLLVLDSAPFFHDRRMARNEPKVQKLDPVPGVAHLK